MRNKLFLSLLLLSMTACGYSKDGLASPKFQGIKKAYTSKERVVFKVMNDSSSKIWYWVAAMSREKDGKFREMGPEDIEEPQLMKTSAAKPLKPGETKTITWPPKSMAAFNESYRGKYKFVIYYEHNENKLDHPQKAYSPEFEVK